jgi:hypothetical protein
LTPKRRPYMNLKHPAVGAVVCALLLFAAPAALAQPSARSAYSTPAGSIQENVGGGEDPPSGHKVAESRGGSLPFTGLDLGLVGAVGGVLLAAGLAARRLSRMEI